MAALNQFDCLRANKATMAHGLEVRVPFLDRGMLDATMTLDPDFKLTRKGEKTQFLEKWALREAFNVPTEPFLPHEVLFRQKEQFSDGVGYSWIDGLKEHAGKVISDEDMATAPIRFPCNTLEAEVRILVPQTVLRCIHCSLLREIRLRMRCTIRVFPPSCVRLFFVGTTRLAQRRPPTSAPSSTRTSQTTTTATASRRPCRAARPSLAPPQRRSSGTRLGPTRPSRTSRDASSIRTTRPSPEGGGG